MSLFGLLEKCSFCLDGKETLELVIEILAEEIQKPHLM